MLFATGLPELDANALARVQNRLRSLGRGGETRVGRGMAFTNHSSGPGHGRYPMASNS